MTRLDDLLAERDAVLVALETHRRGSMPETRRLLRRITSEIRAIDPDALPKPVRWACLPGMEAQG